MKMPVSRKAVFVLVFTLILLLASASAFAGSSLVQSAAQTIHLPLISKHFSGCGSIPNC